MQFRIVKNIFHPLTSNDYRRTSCCKITELPVVPTFFSISGDSQCGIFISLNTTTLADISLNFVGFPILIIILPLLRICIAVPELYGSPDLKPCNQEGYLKFLFPLASLTDRSS